MPADARIAMVLRRQRATDRDVAPDNRRWAQRKLRSLPAYMLSDRLPSATACIVRDMSSTGARLEISRGANIGGADEVPDRFVLFMAADEIEVDCAVAWRNGGRLGVRFVSATRPRPRPKLVRKKK